MRSTGDDERGAVGQCGDSLGASDAVDFGNAGELGGGQDQRVEDAVRRRDAHGYAADAGNLRRDRVHQHRGRVGGFTAGDINSNGVQRTPAQAERGAGRIGELLIGR